MGDSPLWSAGGNNDDQRSRLAELTASTTDPTKDLPLRRDVRSLGIMLGRVLVEQSGESLLGVVEELRRIFIQHREQPRPALQLQTLADLDFKILCSIRRGSIISGLTIEEAHRVTKAFAIYFELTNLAETTHRKRRRRAAKLHPEQPALEGSFRGTLKRMRAAGIGVDQALDVSAQDKSGAGFHRPSHRSGAPHRTAQAPPHCQTIGATRPVASDRRRRQPLRIADLRRSDGSVADR